MKIISKIKTDALIRKYLSQQKQYQVQALDVGTDCFSSCCNCCGTTPCTTCLNSTGRLGGAIGCGGYSGLPGDDGNILCNITSGPPLWGHYDSGLTYCDSGDRADLPKSHCHRLLIWECISNNGESFDGATDPIILVTNRWGANYGGPFYDGFTSGSPSGTLLDMQPYWWEGCNVGGWALGSTWWTPPLSEIYDCLNFAGYMPAVGVDFTLIALVKFKHLLYSSGPHDSGGPPYFPGPPGPYNDEDGYGRIQKIFLQCCDSKETVDCPTCTTPMPKYISAQLSGTGCLDGTYTLKNTTECTWETTIKLGNPCGFCTGNIPSEVKVTISGVFGDGGVTPLSSLNTEYTMPLGEGELECNWYLHFNGPANEFVDAYGTPENWAGIDLGGGYWLFDVGYGYNAGGHSFVMRIANTATPSTVSVVVWGTGFIASPVDCCTELNYSMPHLYSSLAEDFDVSGSPGDAILVSDCTNSEPLEATITYGLSEVLGNAYAYATVTADPVEMIFEGTGGAAPLDCTSEYPLTTMTLDSYTDTGSVCELGDGATLDIII